MTLALAIYLLGVLFFWMFTGERLIWAVLWPLVLLIGLFAS